MTAELGRLYLFDLDGTVIRSFLREGAPRTPENYAEVELLPGRREKLRELEEKGADIAFVTNQGGVAFGYQTLEEVVRKFTQVNFALGGSAWRLVGRQLACSGGDGFFPALFYVAYTHPKATVDRYKADDDWRKPGAGMILKAMRDFRVAAEATTFIGDRDSDRECAANAGVAYVDAEEFFGRRVREMRN